MPDFIKASGLASFSRASVAYLSDGTQVASGAPRYWTGKYDKAIMPGEGTTNILDANQASVETDTTGLFGWQGTETLTKDTAEHWHGAASLKVVTPGTVSDEGMRTGYVAVSPSTNYAGQIKVKGSGTCRFAVQLLDAAYASLSIIWVETIILTSSWQLIKTVVTGHANAAWGRLIFRTSTIQATTFWCDGLQVEAKPFPTFWQLPGTARVNDTLTVPVTGTVDPGGTIAIWVNINDASKRVITNVRPTIFQIPHSDGTYGIRVFHSSTAAQWYIETRNGTGGTGTNATCNDSLTPNGWHQFVITWKSGSPVYLYIDSVLAATISSPEYPTAFAAAMNIGYYTGQIYYGNAEGYDDLRIFNRVLTVNEIAALYASRNAFISGLSFLFPFDSALTEYQAWGLSSAPLITAYKHGAASDPVIRSQMEAGYRQTRPRFTRVPKKWHLAYDAMTDLDRTTMESFEQAMQYGADSCIWTHPKTEEQYTVRLAAPVEYKLSVTDDNWSFELELEEV